MLNRLRFALPLTLLLMVTHVAIGDEAAPEKAAARAIVEAYIQADQAGDDMRMARLFTADSTLEYTIDYGWFYPDDHFEVKMSDLVSEDAATQAEDYSSYFEDYKPTSKKYSIRKVEEKSDRIVAEVKLRENYTYQGYRGESTSDMTFTIRSVDGRPAISHLNVETTF